MGQRIPLLDQYGKPIKRESRSALVGAWVRELNRIHASYDAARTTDEYKNIWANADHFDADSAHAKGVRQTLVSRSRYELANNGFADGIGQTYATDLVGVGPTLRMQTGSTGFNEMVEFQWFLWCKAVHFRRKLWCMAHAKHGDGESLGILAYNRRINHRIQLDINLRETEQCQTPYLPFDEPNRIDGIIFDDFGNPLLYEFLRHHPGSSRVADMRMETDVVAADRVLHWFKMRRPGQHRGVPECASTLNIGAAFRRLREANLSTAEKVAAWTLFLKTIYQPNELDEAAPFSTQDIVHGMMTALPNSMEPYQLKAEHPGPSYDTFHRSLLNEQARPKNMPYNKAACDSSSYNYASGRLDHQTYYGNLDVDREDCNDLVLDPLFGVWFDLAIKGFGWLRGDPFEVSPAARVHTWDWPKHRVADVEAEANANETRLKSGQTFPHIVFTEAGLDFDDEVAKAAVTFSVTEQEIRKRLLDVLLPAAQQAMSKQQPDELGAALLRRVLNGNGAHHG